jgi:hypothetical protein
MERLFLVFHEFSVKQAQWQCMHWQKGQVQDSGYGMLPLLSPCVKKEKEKETNKALNYIVKKLQEQLNQLDKEKAQLREA